MVVSLQMPSTGMRAPKHRSSRTNSSPISPPLRFHQIGGVVSTTCALFILFGGCLKASIMDQRIDIVWLYTGFDEQPCCSSWLRHSSRPNALDLPSSTTLSTLPIYSHSIRHRPTTDERMNSNSNGSTDPSGLKQLMPRLLTVTQPASQTSSILCLGWTKTLAGYHSGFNTTSLSTPVRPCCLAPQRLEDEALLMPFCNSNGRDEAFENHVLVSLPSVNPQCSKLVV